MTAKIGINLIENTKLKIITVSISMLFLYKKTAHVWTVKLEYIV